MSAGSRVVSLLPSATEILFEIGAGESVVGVTHECDFPSAARDLPQVTSSLLATDGAAPGDIDRHIHAARHAGSSIYRLDEAALAALEPDLIVTQELCDVCAVAYGEVTRAVRRLPAEIPVLSLEPRTVEEICQSVEEVGVATGHIDGANRVANEMRSASMRSPRWSRRALGRVSSASNGPTRSWSAVTGCRRWCGSRAVSTSWARKGHRRDTCPGTRWSARDPRS